MKASPSAPLITTGQVIHRPATSLDASSMTDVAHPHLHGTMDGTESVNLLGLAGIGDDCAAPDCLEPNVD